MDVLKKSFPSPYDISAPAGAEGWQDLYPYYLTFAQNLRAQEDEKFWFCDSQHWPNVFRPFETITVEFACKCLGQFNTRHYLVPPANGVDYRIHNGYCYMSPIAVDPAEIPARVPQFMERAGHYFANWDGLLANWHEKIKVSIAELDAIQFTPLPPAVALADVVGGVGLDETTAFLANYDRALQGLYRLWQYHFEFLNLGYAAYLDFFQFCKSAFPGIPDLAIAKMVQGVDSILFRPDDELKKLARLALELGVADLIDAHDVSASLESLRATPAGTQWADAWEAAKDPWFNFTSGNGFYASDKYWLDHPAIPLGYVQDYIRQLRAGISLDRPTEELRAERGRIAGEYAEALDDEARAAFEGKLGLARQVFPYVEDHNFYIEHWSMSVFWRKMRELSRVLVSAGFWADSEDMFYIDRDELRRALFDYCNAWGTGGVAIGPSYWPQEIARRKKIVDALATARPQPVFNKPPEVITEPFTIMLWGITTERVDAWLNGDQKSDELSGMAASPGTVEGVARVITSADQLDLLQDGEILIATITAPSWAPVFGKIRGIVTDIGGMMSHAAIVCREYGLPAVTGTGYATSTIRTGQTVRVNGSTGEVAILA
jgi:pyruvate,water dikinase